MSTISAEHREMAHRRSVTSPLDDVAGTLQQVLTTRLTAYIAGVSSGKTVARWANGEVTAIRSGSEQRLRNAYEIVQLFVSCGEAQPTIRAWFLGINPHLDDVSPAEALHVGQLSEVLSAARAFVAGSY